MYCQCARLAYYGNNRFVREMDMEQYVRFKKKGAFKRQLKKSIPGWIFILPMLFGICVFTLYPMVQSIMYSFHDYDMITKYDFVGFGQYVKLFKDPVIIKAITNTFLFSIINVPMMIVLTYLLAIVLNSKLPGIKAFRVIYYLPCVIPAIAGGIVWSAIMKSGTEAPGIFNQLRDLLGIKPSLYFYSRNFESIRSILVMNIWGVGSGVITWIAAFQNIPEQLYEAAKIDGANKFVQLFRITVPLSAPMLLYNLITLLITNLQFSGTLTFAPNMGAGYDNSTLFLGVKIYNEAFRRLNIGYAAALSWVLLIITAIFTAITFKINKVTDNGAY